MYVNHETFRDMRSVRREGGIGAAVVESRTVPRYFSCCQSRTVPMYIAFWQLHSHLYLEKSRVIWDSAENARKKVIFRLSICRFWLSICRLSICRLSICRLSICSLSIIRPPFETGYFYFFEMFLTGKNDIVMPSPPCFSGLLLLLTL